MRVKVKSGRVYLFKGKPVIITFVDIDEEEDDGVVYYRNIQKTGRISWRNCTNEIHKFKHYPKPYMIVYSAFKDKVATQVLL